MHAGAIQVTSKKIMIFGGMVEHDEQEEGTMHDNGQLVKLSSAVFYLDVTTGAINRASSSLNTPSYYINNCGSMLCIGNKLFAQGFGLSNEQAKTGLQVLADEEPKDKDASDVYNHKKVLHCYNLAEEEFTEVNEGVFTANPNRKASMDLDD
mmetsp:Transcript_35867/g.55021  ORF Transcript_35867/g.55021 Transcript_35867/m.55021 type:complete len:152 (-) Transcript_35867:87-542(-)